MSKIQAVKQEATPVETPAAPEKLQDVDRMALELAKSKKLTALAEAKTALAQNENAELSYRYIILQLYMKYNMGSNDSLSEDGTIIRGGATPQASNT